MSLEITNRVEKSSLKTLDLDFFYPKVEISTFDIKFWLKDELLLIEKEFRKSINQFNWEKFNNKAIAIQCSADAIIPHWAFMLVSSKLNSLDIINIIGDTKSLEILMINQAINSYDFSDYKDKPVIIKGCSDQKIPLASYSIILEKLQPVAKSIMFGEACSSVPVYKSKK
jgi:hypothetical protein